MKQLGIIIITFLYAVVMAAQKDGWQVYLAYSQPVQVCAADGLLYCVMSNGLLDISSTYPYSLTQSGNLVSYDLDDTSVRTFDCLEDLNGQHVKLLSYNSAASCLVLVYDDNNIDIIEHDGQIRNIAGLADKSLSVNRICNIGDVTYLCTTDGIIKLNIYNRALMATYWKSVETFSICLLDDTYYIATSQGVFSIQKDSNMYDIGNWSKVNDFSAYQGTDVVSFGDALLSRYWGFLVITTMTPRMENWTGVAISRMSVDGNLCVCLGGEKLVYLTTDNLTPRIMDLGYAATDVCVKGNRVWVSSTAYGVLEYQYNRTEDEFSLVSEESLFKINSPEYDSFWSMQYDKNGRLLVAGGVHTVGTLYYPATAMMMDSDGKWYTFDNKTLPEKYPFLFYRNLESVVCDPSDKDHFYSAITRSGLVEYRSDANGIPQVQKLYNHKNSHLGVIPRPGKKPLPEEDQWSYVPCSALSWDKNNNLWMANSFSDTIFWCIRPGGQWIGLYYPEFSNPNYVRQIMHSSSGITYAVNQRDAKKGIFGFSIVGAINVTDDDSRMLRSSITNQDGTTYAPDNFHCLAEDKSQQIWVGTDKGLFVITDQSKWFDNDFTFHQIKRNRDDGSGLADYLLSGVEITCITVDGADRKWVGTKTAGLYLFSSDGQQTIHHFTKADSPILSDCVYSIAINPTSGRVMIGTDKGLCSYDERVSQPSTALVEDNINIYPNPVRPNTNSEVTICNLTDQAEVKILSASGQCVWGSVSQGGTLHWNLHDTDGNMVSSGVYHVVINSSTGKPVIVKRLIVIR